MVDWDDSQPRQNRDLHSWLSLIGQAPGAAGPAPVAAEKYHEVRGHGRMIIANGK